LNSERAWAQDKARFVATGPTAATLGPLASEFAQLGRRLLAAPTVAELLNQLVTVAQTVLQGAELVSVTLRDSRGEFSTPVHTDPLAVRLDLMQYSYDEGPCVAATRTPGEGLVTDGDLRTSEHWRHWGPAAAQLGVRSVLAVGLFPYSDPPRMGALNIYSSQPGGLTEIDLDFAVLLASHFAIALAATQAITDAELEASQLREALATRDVIGQAKGVLMERRGCSAEEAFDILRRTSQQLNVKLAELADAVVARRHQL
jgi:GAF domain-containing protein